LPRFQALRARLPSSSPFGTNLWVKSSYGVCVWGLGSGSEKGSGGLEWGW
jgi:hypothetical protein